MAGKQGYEATLRLRVRPSQKRGGRSAKVIPFHRSEGTTLADYHDAYLEYLRVRHFTESTVVGRQESLRVFLVWAQERELTQPQEITKPILESYQRHLWRYRKKNGKPLGVSTQRGRLGAVKDYFSWLCRQNVLVANPASDLEMPRPQHRLPEQALSENEIESLMNVPDIGDPLGLRDRALYELLYSTGMRRSELVRLKVEDLNQERRTLQIKQGKGRKDRVVPVGQRAMRWMVKYLEDIRPLLLVREDERALFLTSYGETFNADVLSRMVSKSLKTAGIKRNGSCHLLRHTCATHMLEGGADIRYIQQLLGHASLDTTSVYTQVTIQQLRRIHSQTHPAERAR
ncbi:MAG: site-specific tyrosine recombinase XerC [Boseongicola sp.]|nr:site-specific tyrosine recombinase XerC [Boseongicola sp.]